MNSQILLLFALSTLCFSFSQPLCSDRERLLLLQFKENFFIEELASRGALAYSKTDSWGRDESDCCDWDGVECHGDTSRVIGLDLSSSFLYGSISSNTSLVGLTHLQRFNLADNHFNYSRIPSSIDRLSKLTYLNLSRSAFSGQIPSKILSLSRLSCLDLSLNIDYATGAQRLELKNPSFETLTESLTSLKLLNLRYVDISAKVSESLANSSSLEFLSLMACGLKGAIPLSIGKLQHLSHLDFSRNSFTGQIPSSLANLTQLEYLSLSSNGFETGNLSWLSNLAKINYLGASEINLSGPIPSTLGNLTRLVTLMLSGNHLSGTIPLSLAGLVNLEILRLGANNLSGEVDFSIFPRLKNITVLNFSHNRLSVVVNKPTINETLPQFTILGLTSCNVVEFPNFLRHQKRLEILILNKNEISGNVPKWLWNMSTQTLQHLDLGGNFLRGHLPPLLPFVNLFNLIICENSFTGPIPIPHSSIFLYEASINAFTGEIPTSFCNMSSLETLSLFNNELSGGLPHCLGNFVSLSLYGNRFSRITPQTFTSENRLMDIDVSQNQLQGQLPHSFSNFTMLQYFNVKDNKLDDVFPYWLGTLPDLRILILRSNRFHGEIKSPGEEPSHFPQLQIIDLSYNSFSGALPSQYFKFFKAMQGSVTASEATYSNSSISSSTTSVVTFYYMNIKIKGVNRPYKEINQELSIMDLSHNKFSGEIPETIKRLKRLRSLDLSNNSITGHIPSSLGSLTELESLDLSSNQLSGKVPEELTHLTFLQYFNVSDNRLVGPIPQEGQLGTFMRSSYEGNLGLCGTPLQNKCEAPKPLHSSFEEKQEDSSSPFNFGWKVVAIGYGCGLPVGLLIGQIVVAKRKRWFTVNFWARMFK